jgi:hypothetical protein
VRGSTSGPGSSVHDVHSEECKDPSKSRMEMFRGLQEIREIFIIKYLKDCIRNIENNINLHEKVKLERLTNQKRKLKNICIYGVVLAELVNVIEQYSDTLLDYYGLVRKFYKLYNNILLGTNNINVNIDNISKDSQILSDSLSSLLKFSEMLLEYSYLLIRVENILNISEGAQVRQLLLDYLENFYNNINCIFNKIFNSIDRSLLLKKNNINKTIFILMLSNIEYHRFTVREILLSRFDRAISVISGINVFYL